MRRHAAAALLWLALASPLTAQTTAADPVDWQGRGSLTLKLDLPKKWAMAVGYEGRLEDDLARWHGSYVNLDVDRRVGRGIALTGDYRLARTDAGTYHRVGLGIEGSRKFAGITAGLRVLGQHQTKHHDDGEDNRDDFLRLRARVSRELGKHTGIYFSVEPAFQFEGGYLIDSWRNRLGLRQRLIRGLEAEAYYVYRPDYGRAYNRTFHTLGVDLTWSIKVRG